MSPLESGAVVALTGCVATRGDGTVVQLSGLFELVEHESADPSAGIYSSGWLVVPAGAPEDGWEALAVVVDDAEVFSQVDPVGFGRALAEERALEAALEEEALSYGR